MSEKRPVAPARRELRAAQRRQLQATAARLFEFDGLLPDYPAHLFSTLARVVPTDYAVHWEFNAATGQARTHISAPIENEELRVAAYLRDMHCHPLFGADLDFFGDRVLGNRDFFSDREFRELPICRDGLAGARHLLNLRFASNHWTVCLGLYRVRGRAFTGRDRDFLEALHPYLRRAYELVRLRTVERMNSLERVRALHPELSDRRQEVLAWFIEGKTYAHIGQILAISPETVKTHVRQLLAKLQIDSRAEAILKIFDPAGSPHPTISQTPGKL